MKNLGKLFVRLFLVISYYVFLATIVSLFGAGAAPFLTAPAPAPNKPFRRLRLRLRLRIPSYRNIISDVLKKKVSHSHASHKARGHCSISLLHVVTPLIMGGRYTRYRDWPFGPVGIASLLSTPAGNICHIDHNGAPCYQDIERRLTDLRSQRSGGGATQRAERSCRQTADTVPTSC